MQADRLMMSIPKRGQLVLKKVYLWFLPVVAGFAVPQLLSAHEGAIYAEPVPMVLLPRVTNSYAFSYPELGNGAFRAELSIRTVADRRCATAGALGFDVNDLYAFDVDEEVELTLVYAPAYSGSSFNVFWDANGGSGVGQHEVLVEPGAPLRQVTLTLDRARLAGQGSRGVDIAVSSRDNVTICDFQIERSGTTTEPESLGDVQLTLRDAGSGAMIPARVGLYDSTGRLPLPSSDALVINRFGDDVRRFLATENDPVWPSESRQVFYVNGQYGAKVPAGTYAVVVSRGLEYLPYIGELEVEADGTTEIEIELERYDDLTGRNWYSLDGHVHVPRSVVEDRSVWAFGAAEDIRILSATQMGNLSRAYFVQPAWGIEGEYSRGGYAVMPNQEDPRTVQHGHTLHYNMSQQVRLPTDRYYSYHDVFEEVSRIGGTTGYAHHGQLFNGRRGLALDVPFGIVDFIEVLQNGRLGTDPWYDFLNLGYKILPMAGSDFPYMDLPGAVRVYSKVEGEFTTDKWFESFQSGNAFVSNGPFLEMTVNGQPIGSEIHVNEGETLDIVAEVDLNPAVDELDRLELVVFGEVVATQEANGNNRIRFETEITAEHSQWLALRAFGKTERSRGPAAVAHTAATWILVDGQPAVKQEGLAELVELQRTRLREFMNDFVDPVGDLEPWETAGLMEVEWARQLAGLRERIEEAAARYMDFLEPR